MTDSTSFREDETFLVGLLAGVLAEIFTERLLVHAGWFVRHTGDQYRGIISPEEDFHLRKEDNRHTPDFSISRTEDFRTAFSLEVKSCKDAGGVQRKGSETIRITFFPGGYKVEPKRWETELKISPENWTRADSYFQKIWRLLKPETP